MASRAVLATLLALSAMLVGCRHEESSAPPPALERFARQLAPPGAKNVIVHVADEGDEWSATAGAARPNADQRFRIGSVTKTFTAVIVLQLVEEGAFELDDTLEEHVPGVVPRGDEITIRQLLSHRSGLVNVTDDVTWLEKASRSSATSPIKTLRYAASLLLDFEPDARESYSNTNYIALGLVIESATGRTYAEELEERILEPLGLDRTELPATRRLADLDDEGENPNLPWAAGALVSNAQDLARFFSALLSGDVLSDESLVEMKRGAGTEAGTGSGLGIFPTDLECGRFWGHGGGIVDYITHVNVSDDGSRALVISIQGGTPSGPPDESVLLCEADESE